MTTALRITEPAAAPVDHAHAALIAENARLVRELRQRSTTIAALRRELTRAIEAPTVVGERMIDGMLTVTLSTGAVLQRRPTCVETPTSFEYGFRWMAIEPVADTAAQIVDGTYADAANVPEHYATAQERLLSQRLFGQMAVAGGAD